MVYTFTPPLHWCEALPESVSGRAVVTGKVSFDSAVDGLDNVDSVDRMCFPDLLGNCQINVQEFMPNIMQGLLQFCDLVI